METGRKSTLHVPEDVLDKRKVGLARIVHEQADLLHCVCKIRSSQREVLKGAGETPVLSGIGDGGALSGRELGTSVNGGRCRVTLGHACTLEKIQRVLALGEEEPVGGARDGDPEEVVEVAEVCHGELRVQTLGDALQESWSRGRQDDVVDVEEQVRRGTPS